MQEEFNRICEELGGISGIFLDFWVSSIKMFNNFDSKQGEVLDGDRDGKYVDSDVK